MRVLITGAAGFLGTECVKQFKINSYDVITTDKVGDVDLKGDLSDSNFTNLLPNVDIVVNCAAVQYVTKNLPILFRSRFFRVNNVIAAKNLSERYRSTDSHFIHVGTSMMYRQTGQNLYTVSSAKGGEGVYSKSKLHAQEIIDNIKGSATVVPCIIGGEGREGLFRGFVIWMKRFGVVPFPGAGRHKIHMVHVSDVASLILQVASVRASGLFNAAAPDALTIRQWINEIKMELGIISVFPISVPLFPVKLISALFGYRLLAKEQLLMLEFPHVLDVKESISIGWQPKYSNARIARDIAAYISRGN